MKLNIQISLIFFSLIFGFLFSLFFNIGYKWLHHPKKIINLLSNILFILISLIIYFNGLQIICNGIFHIYSLLLIIIGFIVENIIGKLIEKKIKKCYNCK